MKAKKKPASKASPSEFEYLYHEVMVPFFDEVQDRRRENSSYELSDALKSGYAIYSLKSPSLFYFRQKSEAEESNLKTIYGIRDIPSDNGLRKILDGIPSEELREAFALLFSRIKQEGLLKDYYYWNKHLVVSIEGVEHFSSKKISCPHCLQRTHRDGSRSNYHSMLSAAVVCPGEKEVFVMDNEPIVRQGGEQKNDCELNAAKRLLDKLQLTHNQEFMVLTMDALYACAPLVCRINENPNWRYVINAKESSHQALFEQFDRLNEEHKVHWEDIKTAEGTYTFGYVNKLSLNDSNRDVLCNFLYCIWMNKKGEEKIFSWITNITLSRKTIMPVMRMGRSRWKIENEVFNTLKNQDYNFSHNFGHGEENLCTNFAYLMMLAFTVDQAQQRACKYFQAILKHLKTKLKLWEAVKAVFRILPCESMTELYGKICKMYQIQVDSG